MIENTKENNVLYWSSVGHYHVEQIDPRQGAWSLVRHEPGIARFNSLPSEASRVSIGWVSIFHESRAVTACGSSKRERHKRGALNALKAYVEERLGAGTISELDWTHQTYYRTDWRSDFGARECRLRTTTNCFVVMNGIYMMPSTLTFEDDFGAVDFLDAFDDEA